MDTSGWWALYYCEGGRDHGGALRFELVDGRLVSGGKEIGKYRVWGNSIMISTRAFRPLFGKYVMRGLPFVFKDHSPDRATAQFSYEEVALERLAPEVPFVAAPALAEADLPY